MLDPLMAEGLPEIFSLIVFFVFGTVLGSFSNVLIVRLPEEESILPSSHCRSCKKKVQWRDNIPIFSWLLRFGRCRHCGERYSFQYLVVEVLMGVLFAACYQKFGWSFYLFEVLIFVFGTMTAAFIDLKYFILPDIFTLGGLLIGLVGAALNPEREFLTAFMGAFIGGGIFYAVAYLFFIIRKKEGMGGGDIKLLAWIGALLGWQPIPVVIMLSCLVGGFFGLLLVLLKKQGLEDGIPYGPFLVAAAYFCLFFDAQTIVQWYLEFSGFS